MCSPYFIKLSQNIIVFLSTIALCHLLCIHYTTNNSRFNVKCFVFADHDVVFSWFARNEWLALTDLLCVILLFVYCCCECYIIYNVLVLLLLLNGVDYFCGSCDKRSCVIYFFFYLCIDFVYLFLWSGFCDSVWEV